MKSVGYFALAGAITWCAPAMAGEEILYGAPPAWVKSADIDAAMATPGPLVLLDRQVRMEDGDVRAFTDIAFRVESPEALTALGTLKLGWLPDKGDLLVHRLEILRGDEVIDLLAQGARYDVLRRERQLEQRSLDGSLTATIAVPGLKVGDVLRYSQTISKRDQALGGEVQELDGLLALPTTAGLARMIISWREGDEMHWKASGGFALPEPEVRDGYTTLTVTMPLPKPAEMPEDAPARFKVPPLLQVGSFATWSDLSRTMGPHFATEGKVTPGGAIAAEVARIKREARDPLPRAALALQLVQDQVSYLMDGMNGGNYLPQSPEQTWQLRYGDCKAKSLLLVAILREMGIEAEVVLVRSSQGDVVAEMLPLPVAFDHAIVRAVIGGEDYWLDGTSAGTRLDTIDEVPDFAYALPIRSGGADLMPLRQRLPKTLDRTLRVTYDYRAGVDMPAVVEAEVEARGVMGAAIRAKATETDAKKRLDYASEYLGDLLGDTFLYNADITYDERSGIARIKGTGVLYSPWQFERERGSLALDLPSTGLEFNPDRARAEWRSIPVAVGGPLGLREEVTVLLPEDGTSYELTGRANVDDEVAGIRVSRTAELSANRLRIADQWVRIPGEIAVSAVAGEKVKAARLRSGDPVLRTAAGVAQYWAHPVEQNSERLARLEQAYAALIAVDPEEAWRWSLRGSIRQFYPDDEGALADYDKAIEIEPTAERFADRATLLQEMGRLPQAVEDATLAYELDPTIGNATLVANIRAELGQFDTALAALDELDLSGDDRIALIKAKASLLGELHRVDEGWELLEQALAERPDDPDLLDSQCWYMGNWSYALDQALETCNRAVRTSQYAASPLDSRALVQYRLRQSDAALDDLKAALASEPGYGSSLYLRGVIRLEQGDNAGSEDIARALRVWGGVGRLFSRFGITPAS